MKAFCLLSFLLLLLFGGSACERHPASQTLPPLEAKHESQAAILGSSKNSPKFFLQRNEKASDEDSSHEAN